MAQIVSGMLDSLWKLINNFFNCFDFQYGTVCLGPGDPQQGYKQVVQIDTCRPVCRVWFNVEACNFPCCGQENICYVGEATILPKGFQFVLMSNAEETRIKWFAVER